MSVKQISVFLENKPGALSDMTQVLADNGIDMRAFSLAETSDFGIARIIVDDLYKTTTVLKDAGFVHSVSSVLAVAIPDVPGGLNQVLAVLRDENINVEYMYAFLKKVHTLFSTWQTLCILKNLFCKAFLSAFLGQS